MLKKYLLFFLFLFYPFSIYASIWGNLGGCITNPCNCGQGERAEVWNSGSANEVKKTFLPGTLCPPWNKSDGRDTDNCLLQFDYPGSFIGFLLSRCAQESPDSSYFTPKIAIKIQSCNAAACWSQSTTLNWDGQCVIWPTGYGLPLTRVCARVAVPSMPPPPGINASPYPADPGYTPNVHLNIVGYPESDNTIIGVDGQILTMSAPKLCAYSDPGLVNLASDSGLHVDPFDWNPNSQPLHQTTQLSPIAQVLAFLLSVPSKLNLPTLLAKLLGMISQDSEIIKVLQTVLNAIGNLFNFFPNAVIIPIIETFGSLNNTVDSYSFGCVQIPLGPYPPPFCQSLNELSVSAVINNICHVKNPDGTFNQSSTLPPCVVSNIRNNIINNTVRVSFNNLIPICTGTNPDLTTCVQINGSFTSASGIHTATAYTDLIKPCNTAATGAPCINTQIPLSCNVTANGCDQGFRIVYSQLMDSLETPSDYFVSDIPDCGTTQANNSTSCQKIWGANIGEFIDISVSFPAVQNQDPNSLMPIQQNFTLRDNNNKARTLSASISNTTTDTQGSENICVFESSSLTGCVPRVQDSYNLTTYECSTQYAGITCPNNTYYTPQFIASMQVIDNNNNIIDQTSTLVTPLSYAAAGSSSTATESVVMLAGYNYSSSVAFIPTIPPKDPQNDQYIAMPFSGTNSLNQSTIYGTYKDNPPYDSNGNINPNAVYLKYLEYINGKYIQGGTHACLMPKNFQHCSSLPPAPCPLDSSKPCNTTNNSGQINCVLAKLNTADTVDCNVFKTKFSTYSNLGLCSNTTGCTQAETITGSGQGITIYNCGASSCYTNNDNPNTPICALSSNYQSRITPAPDIGPILDSTQYYPIQYDPTTHNPTYDASVSDVRDKTWQELGLCSRILVPTCAAITTPSNSSGNALWPETDIGDLAQGTCPLNWIQIDPSISLQRYCLSNVDTKTVAFEPLGQNAGCRKSTGLPVEIVNNTFPTQLVNTPYNPITKIGDFILNVVPVWSWQWHVMAFPENPETFIDASNQPDGTALYTITFKITLDALISDIDYFQILDLWYDDCVLVYVNDQKVLSAPIDSVDSLNDSSQCNNGYDQGMALQANVNNQPISQNNPIDIKPYLKQGDNIITFQLRVMYGGGLYYHMQYKMLR